MRPDLVRTPRPRGRSSTPSVAEARQPSSRSPAAMLKPGSRAASARIIDAPVRRNPRPSSFPPCLEVARRIRMMTASRLLQNLASGRVRVFPRSAFRDHRRGRSQPRRSPRGLTLLPSPWGAAAAHAQLLWKSLLLSQARRPMPSSTAWGTAAAPRRALPDDPLRFRCIP